MKCRECPDYAKCVKESNLAIKRKNCPKARTEKVKTNGDRIRAMSDEELAKLIAETPICNEKWGECWTNGCDCEQCLLEWLKQPAEVSDDES